MKIQITVAAIVVSLMLLAFWFWPYGDEFTSEYSRVADKVAEIIEQDQTSDGVSKARTYFSTNNSVLKGRLKAVLKPDKDGKISEGDRRRYQEVVNKYSARLSNVADKHPELNSEISQLRADMGLQRLSY